MLPRSASLARVAQSYAIRRYRHQRWVTTFPNPAFLPRKRRPGWPIQAVFWLELVATFPNHLSMRPKSYTARDFINTLGANLSTDLSTFGHCCTQMDVAYSDFESLCLKKRRLPFSDRGMSIAIRRDICWHKIFGSQFVGCTRRRLLV